MRKTCCLLNVQKKPLFGSVRPVNNRTEQAQPVQCARVALDCIHLQRR